MVSVQPVGAGIALVTLAARGTGHALRTRGSDIALAARGARGENT